MRKQVAKAEAQRRAWVPRCALPQALSNIPEGRPGWFEVRTPASGSGCSGLAEALYVKIQVGWDVVFA